MIYSERIVQVSVPHLEWRVLREVARSRKPVLGSALRLEMSRRTKDGSFITELVRRGLLKTESRAQDPFGGAYSLTELGKHAAEYGVFEVDFETYKSFAVPTPARPGPKPTKLKVPAEQRK